MTPEAERRRMIALARLAERARRISLIRRSVVAGAAATFVLAWGLALGNQLAHGTKTHPGESTTTTGEQGTASFASPSTQCACALVFVSDATAASHASRLASRNGFVRKRGSWPSCGRPAKVQNFWNWLSLPTARIT